MKKVLTTRSFFVLGLFGIFYVCPFFVDAHSGRTDSRGGHYNRKTGEYHYHGGGDLTYPMPQRQFIYHK